MINFNKHYDNSHSLKIHLFNVGHGDCTLVQVPQEETDQYLNFIIDMRISPSFQQPFLRYLNMICGVNSKNLKSIVITHPHDDHYSGLDWFLELPDFNEQLIYVSPNIKDGGARESVIWRGIRTTYLKQFRSSPFPNPPSYLSNNVSQIQINRISPQQNYFNSKINNLSQVLAILFAKRTIVMTGDVEISGWNSFTSDPLECDLLKVAHHGSINGTPSDIKDKLKCSEDPIAIITSGSRGAKDRDTGENLTFPAPETIDRLNEITGINIYYMTNPKDSCTPLVFAYLVEIIPPPPEPTGSSEPTESERNLGKIIIYPIKTGESGKNVPNGFEEIEGSDEIFRDVKIEGLTHPSLFIRFPPRQSNNRKNTKK